MIRARNLSKSFGELQVLKGIDLDITENEIVSIVGASGAGKSTLLQILGTIDKATTGKVYINDVEVNKLADKRTCPLQE